ncbi:unnamed protein product [Cylindrotheca closterium]|uniref:G-protein coupled receptors family 3 profile domain-containing protein n=1 Tax=Cylindrotheca closterium TaxID=2856 RepID=A0AAD2G0T0_9STRA|nr:unnamed protein product [Cylindrotheca closterium]
MHRFNNDSPVWIALIAAATITESAAQIYPEEITLKAGVIPSTSFGGFMGDLLDRLKDIALEDNVTLTVEEKTIQGSLYGPNLALISPDCNPGETVEVNGLTYNCSDYDFIIGNYWPNPERYTLVDFTPPWLTTSVSMIKYTEKTKNPNLDVTTLTEATRTGVPVCALESSYAERLVIGTYPDVNILHCGDSVGSSCLTMLENEDCLLIASDELYLRALQTKFPHFEMTGEHLVRQLLAWPMRKSLDPTSSFLLNKWIYAAISNQVIDQLFFEYFEKKLCPIGTAGADCELPCDPDHGSSNAQGQCVCKSIRWTGDDCSVDVPQELNLVPHIVETIAYSMFGLNAFRVLVGGIWLRVYRESPAVKYSQPGFLALVLIGCLISTSSIPAMVQEDEGDGPVPACIAIPWLYSVGFSITFGTLFAKIRRVYEIFAQGHQSVAIRNVDSNRRTSTSWQDTLSTIGKVLLLDVVILVLWTSVDPLYWKREIIRQDQFGFTLESQGYCVSEHWTLFLGALVALHIALCCIACYMCYVSRNIPSRYSEHKYLTIAMVSNLQVFAIGGTYDGGYCGYFACLHPTLKMSLTQPRNTVPVLIITEDDPAAHAFVRSAVVWMNDFVVLVLIFGNLMYTVHCSSKSPAQMTGRDKRKVSEAVRSFEPRSVAPSVNRKTSQGPSLERSERSFKTNKIKSIHEVSIESDIENGSAGNALGSGTKGTSGSFSAEKGSEIAISELSMSGFEESTHEVMSAVAMTPATKSKAKSAARWGSSPSPSSRDNGESISSFGPSIPTRGETVFDQPEGDDGVLPSRLPISSTNDDDDGDAVKAEGEKSQQNSILSKHEFQNMTLDGAIRLTSIAELEWSDEEDNLTNQTPPAMLESFSHERAPVMPRRLPGMLEPVSHEQAVTPRRSPERLESTPPEQAPVMPRRFESEVLEA